MGNIRRLEYTCRLLVPSGRPAQPETQVALNKVWGLIAEEDTAVYSCIREPRLQDDRMS